MPISSLILRTEPAKTDGIVRTVEALEKASVSHVADANIIVLTETADQGEDKELWDVLEQIDGVLAVELTYHNFEDMEEVEQ